MKTSTRKATHSKSKILSKAHILGKKMGSMKKGKSFLKKIDTLTVVEVAAVLAAGFMVWKNKDSIVSFLKSKGIKIGGEEQDTFAH